MSKTIPAPSENATQVSDITPALVAKKKVAKIAKQKPAHGAKRYTEAERNIILGKKKEGVPLTTLKNDYGVTPKTIGMWLKKAAGTGVAAKMITTRATKQKPPHGSKRYSEKERNFFLDKIADGATPLEIKNEFGVTPKTISKWLKKAAAKGSAPKVKVAAVVTSGRSDVVKVLTQAIKNQEAYINKLKEALEAALTG